MSPETFVSSRYGSMSHFPYVLLCSRSTMVNYAQLKLLKMHHGQTQTC